MREVKTYHNPINGEYTKILQTAAETDGAYTLFEVSLSPGGGNPIHYHTKFTEEFFAVSGPLGLQKGRHKVALQPGQSSVVPLLAHHRFFNDSDNDIIFRVKLTPGQPTFENFLKGMFGLVNDGKTITKNQIPKNIFHIAVMFAWGDTHLVNPFVKLSGPILKKLYKTAVNKGIEQQLLDAYCKD
ncbi:MAG: cupin domain-containing protein [Bacteroidota bacterium]